MPKRTLLIELDKLGSVERYSRILDLAEQQDSDIYSIILNDIEKIGNGGQIGSLVYALSFYPAEPLFDKAIDWLIEGNFEVAHLSFEIINKISYISGKEVSEAYDKIQKSLLLPQVNWRYELLNDVLDMYT